MIELPLLARRPRLFFFRQAVGFFARYLSEGIVLLFFISCLARVIQAYANSKQGKTSIPIEILHICLDRKTAQNSWLLWCLSWSLHDLTREASACGGALCLVGSSPTHTQLEASCQCLKWEHHFYFIFLFFGQSSRYIAATCQREWCFPVLVLLIFIIYFILNTTYILLRQLRAVALM